MSINELKEKLLEEYKSFDFYEGFLLQTFESSLKINKKEKEINKQITSNFKNSIKKYIVDNKDKILPHLSKLITSSNQKEFCKICSLFDSINLSDISYIQSIYEKNEAFLNKMLGHISNYMDTNNLDSNILANFMMIYQSKTTITEIDEYDNRYEETDDNNTEYDSVRLYLKEISTYPLLKPEEEIELFRRYNEGEIDLRDRLVNSNLRLVVDIAKHYFAKNKKIDYMDLIMEGNAGLMKAVERFDYKLGYKFSTYATWWIKQSIKRELDNHDQLIRIPVYAQEKNKKINKAKEKFTSTNGREPTKDEIKNLCKVSERDLENYDLINNLITNTVSINSVVGEDEDCELQNFISDESQDIDEILDKKFMADELSLIIENAGLSYKELNIIKLRMGLIDGRELTLDEIGKKFNLTRERIRQLESRALKKLRYSGNRIRNRKQNKFVGRNGNVIDLNKSRHITDIYTYYSLKYTEDQIKEAIKKTNTNSARLLKTVFGCNLNEYNQYEELTTIDSKAIIELLSVTIPSIINGAIEYEDAYMKNFYEYFSYYQKEEVELALKMASEKDLTLLRLAYNNGFSNRPNYNLIPNENIKQFNRALYNMQTLLTKNRSLKSKGIGIDYSEKNFYEEFEENTIEEVNHAIYFMTQKQCDELFKLYEGSLSNKICIAKLTQAQRSKRRELKSIVSEILSMNKAKIKKLD